MNSYEEKQEARKQRYRELADKAKPRVCREEVTVFLQKQNNTAN